MKSIHVTLTILATACFGGNVWAQASGQAVAPMITPAGTKIGMVNLGVLLRDQEKIKVYKAKLDLLVKPFDEKTQELEKYVTSWTEALRAPDCKLSDEKKFEGQKVILECRRRLTELAEKYQKEIGDDFCVQLLKFDAEIKQAIKVYAETHGYHLVLAYGEPDKSLPVMAEFHRRMESIDDGHTAYMPLTGMDSQDITRNVLDILNASYRASMAEPRK